LRSFSSSASLAGMARCPSSRPAASLRPAPTWRLVTATGPTVAGGDPGGKDATAPARGPVAIIVTAVSVAATAPTRARLDQMVRTHTGGTSPHPVDHPRGWDEPGERPGKTDHPKCVLAEPKRRGGGSQR